MEDIRPIERLEQPAAKRITLHWAKRRRNPAETEESRARFFEEKRPEIKRSAGQRGPRYFPARPYAQDVSEVYRENRAGLGNTSRRAFSQLVGEGNRFAQYLINNEARRALQRLPLTRDNIIPLYQLGRDFRRLKLEPELMSVDYLKKTAAIYNRCRLAAAENDARRISPPLKEIFYLALERLISLYEKRLGKLEARAREKEAEAALVKKKQLALLLEAIADLKSLVRKIEELMAELRSAAQHQVILAA